MFARVAFGATATAYAADSAERAIAALDEHAQAWTEAWARSCDADDVTATARDRARACLRVSRAELDTVASVLERASGDVVVRATALTGLEPIDCDDSVDAGQASAAYRVLAEALGARTVAAKVHGDAGRYAPALAQLRPPSAITAGTSRRS